MIGVSEMTIVNREKGRTKPIKKNFEALQKLSGIESTSILEQSRRKSKNPKNGGLELHLK